MDKEKQMKILPMAIKMIKLKYLFIVLFISASLPLVLACGEEEVSQVPVTANAVYSNNIMSSFYGMGFFAFLIMVLVTISLLLFIMWMIKNLKKSKK